LSRTDVDAAVDERHPRVDRDRPFAQTRGATTVVAAIVTRIVASIEFPVAAIAILFDVDPQDVAAIDAQQLVSAKESAALAVEFDEVRACADELAGNPAAVAKHEHVSGQPRDSGAGQHERERGHPFRHLVLLRDTLYYGRMRHTPLAIATVVLTLLSAPAYADITGFIGANTTPDNRQTRGFAVGLGLLIVGFEFEFADTPDSTNPSTLAPSLKTGMGNALLQPPTAVLGFQPYVTAGAGIYNEALGEHSETNVALNTGGGVKINLIGPVRLRVDYRVFKLNGGALYTPAHRVYAGLNIKF
jgi:hypothetical protein